LDFADLWLNCFLCLFNERLRVVLFLSSDSKIMKSSVIRVLIAVLVVIVIGAGGIWMLCRSLNDPQTLYAGRTLDVWMGQLKSRDAGASNQANEVLNAEIIPRLTDEIFHDTNDSEVKLSPVHALGLIPGVQIRFPTAMERRNNAVRDLGYFGPPAAAATPSLIRLLAGPESESHDVTIQTLGKIHSNPDAVIPLLIPFLTNDDCNENAATALGEYGSLAKDAFPKILPLAHAKDRDTGSAARAALKKIDPEAAAKVLAGPPPPGGK
jgi:hypothetical protein